MRALDDMVAMVKWCGTCLGLVEELARCRDVTIGVAYEVKLGLEVLLVRDACYVL